MTRAPCISGLAAAALLAGLGAVAPRHAAAQPAELDSTTTAQSYVVRSPYGDPTVHRRRFTQTVGLSVAHLHGGNAPGGPRLSLVTRLRLDADLGQEDVERDAGTPDRYIPGLEGAPLDLMVAYLEAQNYAGGWLGGRLGRQYLVDTLGYWSFDGALVSLTTPVHARLEVYGGFEQRGGVPTLATSRFSADGVWRGSRTGLEDHEWPSYLEESRPAPAYGVTLETAGLQWMQARIGYRKVINRDRVSLTALPVASPEMAWLDEDRVSTERVGGSLTLTESRWGAMAASAVYDLLSQALSEHAASLRWYLTSRVTVGVEYDYFLPTFDGDSIFNWFTHDGMTTYLGRGSWQITRRVAASASTGVRQFHTEHDPDEYGASETAYDGEPAAGTARGTATDALASAALRYHWTDGEVGLTGNGEAGDSGHQFGADLSLAQRFEAGTYDTLLILSAHDWRDGLRAGRDATGLSYVLGGGLWPGPRTRFGVEWEHAHNRLVGNRFRWLATLDLQVLP